MTIIKKGNKVELRSYTNGKKIGEFDSVKEARKKLMRVKYLKKLRSKK